MILLIIKHPDNTTNINTNTNMIHTNNNITMCNHYCYHMCQEYI